MERTVSWLLPLFDVFARQREILAAEFDARLDFGAFVPLVPRGDQDAVEVKGESRLPDGALMNFNR